MGSSSSKTKHFGLLRGSLRPNCGSVQDVFTLSALAPTLSSWLSKDPAIIPLFIKSMGPETQLDLAGCCEFVCLPSNDSLELPMLPDFFFGFGS